MNDLELITLYQIILGVFFVCIMVFFIHKIYVMKHSEVTRRAAAKVFRMHGGIRGWKVLSDVTLGEGDEAVTADHVAIGSFGVIVACDLHQKGKVYGDANSGEWVVVTGDEGREVKVRIQSPYHRGGLFVEQLRREFAKHKIYSVPVELMVPKTRKQECYITGVSQYVFDLRELKAQLEKTRFEKDNGVSIEAVAAIFKR